MEPVFYICSHCGNVAHKPFDKGPPLFCCGEKMQLLKAGVTDAAQEKHVPAITRNGNQVTISVGSVTHPMDEDHYITFIAAVADGHLTFAFLKPGEAPEMTITAKGPVTAFEYCNKHGLWKGAE